MAQIDKPGWEDRPLPQWQSSVPATVVDVDGPIDIRWEPVQFEFKAGKSTRYIDFADGDDSNSGQSPDQAWKHHPWDSQASANAAASKGAHTYVFKGGVIYRGSLVGSESGTAEEPIRLTRDPKWGEGPATIAGTEVISGWQRMAAAEETDAQEQPTKTIEFEWGSVELPAQAAPGGQVTLTVRIAEGAIADRTTLRVDTHWFEHQTRRAGGPPSAPHVLEPGEARTVEVEMMVPKHEKMSAIQYVLYISPSGNWAEKTHSGEAGMGVAVDSLASRNHTIPEAARSHVQVADVPGDHLPTAVWILKSNGERERLTLARWPNWKIEHPYNHFTQWFRAERFEQGFPRTNIFAPKVMNDSDPNAFRGATIWIDHANASGEFSIIGPFPSSVHGYDPKTGRVQVAFTHPVRHPRDNSPFFLENMPGFLDEPGEWFFNEETRKLHVWFPEGTSPENVVLEVAHHRVLIDLDNVQHVEISNLHLTGGNSIDLREAPRFHFQGKDDDRSIWERQLNDTAMAAVRLRNNARHIALSHLIIDHTAGAGIVNMVDAEGAQVRDIVISDNDLKHVDNGGIRLRARSAPTRAPLAVLTDIQVLRNRLHDIGMRLSVDQGGRGIDVHGLAVGEVAGNLVSHVAGQGIDVVGNRMGEEVPLIRIQIHRNYVNETLLRKTDFGGIEFWGIGPAYVYNNISANPIGFVAHRGVYHKNENFYFDHGAKGYLFNNIGWSDERDDAHLGVIGDHFFKEVRNRWNQAFNNTAYNMRKFQSHEGVQGDQQHYLGNLAINMRGSNFSFWRLQEAKSIAYSHNVTSGINRSYYDRWQGDRFDTIEQMREHVQGLSNHLTDQIGWVTDDPPVMDAAKHDFRPTDTSAAIDRGVNVFVPWSLHAEVGEWHFRLHPADPATVLAYDVFPQPFHLNHGEFRMDTIVPGNELTGEGLTAEHYEPGILENWNRGALRFDGKIVLRLPHERLVQDFSVPRGGDSPHLEVSGAERKTVRMDTNNFLIEAVFRAESGSAGTIAGKLNEQAGYALAVDAEGHLTMLLRSGGSEVVQHSDAKVADGRWHHAIAEVDRSAGRITLYINGQSANGAATGTLPAASASLENPSDFLVGERFFGALDYLRVARGTLADANTDINELMAWQFNGPSRHDFADRPVTGAVRDAGALEHPSVSGQQPINYTPPVIAADEPAKAEATDAGEFRMGEDRLVRALAWGSVSVPKQARVGEEVDIQIVFGTETIGSAQKLQIDLHAVVNGQRQPGYGRSYSRDLTQGSTVPITTGLTIRPLDGLESVYVVLYVSPDGKYEGHVLSTEVSIEIVNGND